ncbi:MAG: tRNA pseudouridine(55) synthase TruB [Streptosporangiaceae bacterium]|nr:tRNA pseudouridine(55) synthase TruB [Streptosporangiaceae bacterium]
MNAPDGLVVVDKPGGMTSHDVVARIRRLAGTRRVGHAGTLDPMATGVLVIGVGKATRMLGYLTLADKEYTATIRLGQSTSTDDAEGEVISAVAAGEVCEADIAAAAAALTGDILQVPPAVSAVKVGGRRAYRLARSGTAPRLAPRPVTVREFVTSAPRRAGDMLDVDVTVRCSSGTYVRALARDLGAALGTGGHLTRLRRTRVGGYRISSARTLEQLAGEFDVLPLAQAAAAAFPRRDLTPDEARRLANGGRLATARTSPHDDQCHGSQLTAAGPVAAYAPDGTLVALVAEESGQARPLVVFA